MWSVIFTIMLILFFAFIAYTAWDGMMVNRSMYKLMKDSLDELHKREDEDG